MVLSRFVCGNGIDDLPRLLGDMVAVTPPLDRLRQGYPLTCKAKLVRAKCAIRRVIIHLSRCAERGQIQRLRERIISVFLLQSWDRRSIVSCCKWRSQKGYRFPLGGMQHIVGWRVLRDILRYSKAQSCTLNYLNSRNPVQGKRAHIDPYMTMVFPFLPA